MKAVRVGVLGFVVAFSLLGERLDGGRAAAQTVESSELDTGTVGDVSGLIHGTRHYPNWSDLIFSPTLTQSLGYNNNVLGLPETRTPARGTTRGDWFSSTLVGTSSKFYVGSQDFFIDGNYGLKKYFSNPSYDTTQYLAETGTDWKLTSACSGRAAGSISKTQQPIELQITPGINTLYHNAFTGNANCRIVERMNLLVTGGVLSNSSTQVGSAANNLTASFVRGGFEYVVPDLSTFRVTSGVTDRNFNNRSSGTQGFAASQLADRSTQLDHKFEYQRSFSSKLTIDAMLGLSQVSSVSASTGTTSPTLNIPIYLGSIQWTPTPKLKFLLSANRTVGPPQSLIANAEVTDSQNLVISYAPTERLTFQAGVTKSFLTAGQTASASSANPYGDKINSLNVQGNCAYSLTPFLVATTSIQWFSRTSQNYSASGAVFQLGASYRPR